ncbi:hypothetical protein CIB48_g10679 [Xylaria polymorpha]|nr:hypothetical protein CIB48_g10679 [Xylaria polymorpha]
MYRNEIYILWAVHAAGQIPDLQLRLLSLALNITRSSITPSYLGASTTTLTKMSSRNLSLNQTHGILDTSAAIASMIDTLSGLPSMPPSIYIDLEGVNLSRHGTVSILQIHVRTTSQTYLSPFIPKVFFDVRRDSDALYSHYGIELQNIQDLQLMELATRTHGRNFINGLKKCIEKDMPMSSTERHDWLTTKEEGLKLFDPQKGGSYEVFNQRPLPEKIRIYCVQDVQYLPCLWDVYNRKLTAEWKTRVQCATEDRVERSQARDFNPNNPNMTRAPEGWRWL